LNTAVVDHRVLELEVDQLVAFRTEIRGQLEALAEAIRSGAAYWDVDL
jgi:hypothetical protein